MKNEFFTIDQMASITMLDREDLLLTLEYEGFDLDEIEAAGGLSRAELLLMAGIYDVEIAYCFLDYEACTFLRAIDWFIELLINARGTEIILYYDGSEYDAGDRETYEIAKANNEDVEVVTRARSLADLNAIYYEDGRDIVDYDILLEFKEDLITNEAYIMFEE